MYIEYIHNVKSMQVFPQKGNIEIHVRTHSRKGRSQIDAPTVTIHIRTPIAEADR